MLLCHDLVVDSSLLRQSKSARQPIAAVEMDMIYPSILEQSTLHLQFPQQWLKCLTRPSELALVLGFEVSLGDAVTLSTEN